MKRAISFAAGAAVMLAMAAPAAAQSSGRVGGGGWRHSARLVLRPGVGAGPFVSASQARSARRAGRCVGLGRSCFDRNVDRGLLLGFGFANAYGGLTEDPEALRDQGFFADSGDSWAANGRAVYDYDRGYPYDWYRDSGEAAAPAEHVASAGAMVRCDVTWVRAARGGQSPVRVCRGH